MVRLALLFAGFVLVSLFFSCPTSSSSDAADEAPDVLLSGLALSAGTLTPAFSANVTSYTAAVDYAVSSVVVTPAVADSDLTVTVDGTKIIPGAGTATIALDAGASKAVTIAVKYGTTTKTYTVTVTRAPAVSLSGLSLSKGTLSPGFASAIYSYTATVANNVSSLTVTASVTNASYTVKVNETVIPLSSSGSEYSGTSSSLPIVEGPNTIDVTVSYGDASFAYVITVTRAPSLQLSALTLSAGTLAPSFSPSTADYTASVLNGVSSVTVTPTPAGSGVTVTVDGFTVILGAGSASVALAAGVAKAIPVVVSYGALTNTYTVTVTRAGLPAIQVSGLTDYDDSGSNAVYVSGSTTVYFGTSMGAGTDNNITFTIRNTGTADLTLTGGSPYMTITSSTSDELDFLVFTPPAQAVIPKNTEVYAVLQFSNNDGTSKNPETATLAIHSDDPAGDFVINLTGRSS